MSVFYFILALAAATGISYLISKLVFKKSGSAKLAVRTNIAAFIMLVALCSAVSFSAAAAETTPEPITAPITATGAEAPAPAADHNKGIAFLASAIAIGVAGIGSGIAVAAAAPAAIGATSEDPKNFGRAIIFVALAEGIALYGLLMSFLIYAAANGMK
jgi:V/A-type H+-transporting ATPase subunit K